MAEITIDEVREYFLKKQGREVVLSAMRTDLQIERGSKSWDGIRNILYKLTEQRVVKPSGKRDGVYKVLKKIVPVKVFSVPRARKPPFDLKYPRDYDTGMEMGFAEHVIIREGDTILLVGVSNYGKTTLAMNFLGENIHHLPVLLGNEFAKDGEPTPRFLNRLDAMDWVEWTNGDGEDKFELLPVLADFEDYIKKGRINIVDWINLPGEYYMISLVMETMKQAVGNGINIAVIQKNEDSSHGRGGAMTRDFADLELLIDKHGDYESRITVGKVKEYTTWVTGRSWAYEIHEGVKLKNVREVVKCPTCYGKKWKKMGNSSVPCDVCLRTGFIDK